MASKKSRGELAVLPARRVPTGPALSGTLILILTSRSFRTNSSGGKLLRVQPFGGAYRKDKS